MRYLKPIVTHIKVIYRVLDAKVNNKPVIFVFQPGKVGSMSVYRAILRNNNYTYHTHSILRSKPYIRKMYLYGKRLGLRIFIITPIKNPVTRNVSLYGDKIVRSENTDCPIEPSFMNFISIVDHMRITEWFDIEFKPVTGIDVYKHRFNASKGYSVIDNCLILKSELPDQIKQQVISQFIGINISLSISHNVNMNANYLHFKAKPLPEDYVNRLLSSEYANHFKYGRVD